MSAEWAEPTAVPDNHASPGAQLAAQRQALGWTVEQVAEQLKLAPRQVVALEADNHAALPGTAVVRGFIRAYAKVVKLDAAPLVAMVAPDTPAPTDATATTVKRDKPASFSEVRFPTNGKRQLPIAPIAVGVIALAGLGAAIYFGVVPGRLMSRGDAPSASATVAPPATSKADSQIETTLLRSDQELKPVDSSAVPLISVPGGAANASSAPAAGAPAGVASAPAPALSAALQAAAAQVASPKISTTAPAQPPATPVSDNALVLTVNQDSWIDVRRSHGAPLISRLVKAGNTETFDITEPVTLKVGNAPGVNATLRGVALELPTGPSGSIAKVSVK